MSRKRPPQAPGTTLVLELNSKILAGNPLGDPHVRKLGVWLPPGYDAGVTRGKTSGRGRRYPVLFDLVGYTGSGLAHLNWRPFDENVPERVARLTHEHKMGPCIVVFPDCFTSMGGNQYVNSSAIGRYADYLTHEIVPFVDREFRTLASREHRGVFGKSSGGYGAIVHGMRYPQTWGALANHSGDALFDFCYLTDWPRTLNELDRHRKRRRLPGRVDVLKDERGADRGLAATYDPDPKAPLGFRLPFNLETGEMIPARWKQWQKNDPISMVSAHKDNLKTLKLIYIDCGWRDQYYLHYGARILSKQLAKAGITHVYEEFDDNHSSIDYRMDVSLPLLYRAVKA
jgi:putative esterase